MKSNSMYNFFSLFDLSFRAVYEPCMATHSIIIRCSSKTATSFWYLTWSLIDSDDISSNYLLFLNSFDHFLTQIIYSFHFSSFECDFPSFWSRSYFTTILLEDFYISISTTSPSTISLSYFIRTPIDLLKAWVKASVLLIYSEKISEPASIVKGTSSPKVLAIAIAIAVLPVPGWPPISIARPAILPSLIISRMIPAALLASDYINEVILVQPYLELVDEDQEIR